MNLSVLRFFVKEQEFSSPSTNREVAMSKRILISVSSCLVILVSLTVALRWSIFADDPFHIRGALSEACTCNVPCPCNFGQGPSPHNYCHAVYAYGIKEGSYNGV